LTRQREKASAFASAIDPATAKTTASRVHPIIQAEAASRLGFIQALNVRYWPEADTEAA